MTLPADGLRALLLDADDCLFGSEIPAFEASTRVANELLAALGSERRFTPDELRRSSAGRSFRAIAGDLAAEAGAPLDAAALDRWVTEERRRVTAHLAGVLAPDPAVTTALERLGRRYLLAVVSSSALARLDACFQATGLESLLAPERRFSAEDSLPAPASKPDPAVYAWAGARLGVDGGSAVAVEDSVSGTRSAAGAGFPVIGNLAFVAENERPAREKALRAAGAVEVVGSWAELEAALSPPVTTS